jgi:hypothetical protein
VLRSRVPQSTYPAAASASVAGPTLHNIFLCGCSYLTPHPHTHLPTRPWIRRSSWRARLAGTSAAASVAAPCACPGANPATRCPHPAWPFTERLHQQHRGRDVGGGAAHDRFRLPSRGPLLQLHREQRCASHSSLTCPAWRTRGTARPPSKGVCVCVCARTPVALRNALICMIQLYIFINSRPRRPIRILFKYNRGAQSMSLNQLAVEFYFLQSTRGRVLFLEVRAFTLLAACSNQPHTRKSARMNVAPPPMHP